MRTPSLSPEDIAAAYKCTGWTGHGVAPTEC
jgi:hypothetical protein